MAAWGLLTALSGYEFDVPRGRLGFTPRIQTRDFRTFWSLDSGWGSYTQHLSGDGARCTLSVAYGELSLRQLYLGSVDNIRSAKVTADDLPVPATFAAKAEGGWTVLFGEQLLLKPGQTLQIEIG